MCTTSITSTVLKTEVCPPPSVLWITSFFLWLPHSYCRSNHECKSDQWPPHLPGRTNNEWKCRRQWWQLQCKFLPKGVGGVWCLNFGWFRKCCKHLKGADSQQGELLLNILHTYTEGTMWIAGTWRRGRISHFISALTAESWRVVNMTLNAKINTNGHIRW